MDLICPECGEPCGVTQEDFGIGAYEFWGAPGVDTRLELCSDCCTAPFDSETQRLIGEEQGLRD